MIPLHTQPFYLRVLGSDIASQFPRADRAFSQILSLPLYPMLTDRQVDRVCEELIAVQPSRINAVGEEVSA